MLNPAHYDDHSKNELKVSHKLTLEVKAPLSTVVAGKSSLKIWKRESLDGISKLRKKKPSKCPPPFPNTLLPSFLSLIAVPLLPYLRIPFSPYPPLSLQPPTSLGIGTRVTNIQKIWNTCRLCATLLGTEPTNSPPKKPYEVQKTTGKSYDKNK